jgi:hypothetical protein
MRRDNDNSHEIKIKIDIKYYLFGVALLVAGSAIASVIVNALYSISE